ncbi:nematocyst expressed protein 3-like [Dermacentor silvarum]|uniref:nematocyst expressed protein 3-like n=1 Tax=Dermacentor silvarum TaxID=543639 RepID=UPI0018993931|nr:nematocyst expressed protein 3-like [Dermacentor silvarum]
MSSSRSSKSSRLSVSSEPGDGFVTGAEAAKTPPPVAVPVAAPAAAPAAGTSGDREKRKRKRTSAAPSKHRKGHRTKTQCSTDEAKPAAAPTPLPAPLPETSTAYTCQTSRLQASRSANEQAVSTPDLAKLITEDERSATPSAPPFRMPPVDLDEHVSDDTAPWPPAPSSPTINESPLPSFTAGPPSAEPTVHIPAVSSPPKRQVL